MKYSIIKILTHYRLRLNGKRIKNLILLFILLMVGCKSLNKDRMQVVMFKSFFDFTVEAGKPNAEELFNIKVIRIENITIYIVPTEVDSTEYILSKTTGDVETVKPASYTIYSYHIIDKDKKYGLQYDSLSAIAGKEFKVDSFLNRINLSKQHQIENSKDRGTLVYSLRDKTTGKLLVEKFAAHQIGEFDSTYRYYDYGMKDLDFSIAPLLDRKNDTKTVKVVYVQNPKKTDSVKKNKEKIYQEITKSNYENPKELFKLIAQFKIDRARLH